MIPGRDFWSELSEDERQERIGRLLNENPGLYKILSSQTVEEISEVEIEQNSERLKNSREIDRQRAEVISRFKA